MKKAAPTNTINSSDVASMARRRQTAEQVRMLRQEPRPASRIESLRSVLNDTPRPSAKK